MVYVKLIWECSFAPAKLVLALDTYPVEHAVVEHVERLNQPNIKKEKKEKLVSCQLCGPLLWLLLQCTKASGRQTTVKH